MERLDIVHHKSIITVLILVVLITGILFGVQIASAAGMEGTLTILFALVFLAVALLFVNFMQMVHLADDVKRLRHDHEEQQMLKRPAKSRRGQAALEFITTYGWAMMVVLVMIGALAYFGVINPQRFLPDKCLFKAGFGCNDFQIAQDATAGQMTVRFNIVNNMGETIAVSQVNVTSKNAELTCLDGVASPVPVKSGENLSVVCAAVLNSPGRGQYARVSSEILYKPVLGSYMKIAEGDIGAQVQ